MTKRRLADQPGRAGGEPTRRLPEDPPTRRLGADDPTQRLPVGSPHEQLVIDRYRLERRIGSGGFGTVWLAVDERLQREVAVKIIQRERGGGAPERAEREALVAARLNHPGIVALYELGSDEDAVYLVSELVRGRTLAELERERAISDRDVARIGMALCEALQHAHERGVVHRDLKPANVMVVAEPAAGAGFAKLTDFGVARLASAEELTRTGDVVGTLAYMAPEQAEGSRVGPAADAYSLALTLYEAWTGSNPVRAASPAATARRVGRPLPPLASRRGDVPADLAETVDAALDPDPARRPPLETLHGALARAEPRLSDEGGLVEPETLERVGLAGVPRAFAPPRVALRAAAAVAAGGLVLWTLTELGPRPPVAPAAVGAAVALLVALLPRIGWLIAALGVCGWLVSSDADRAGTALVLGAALLPVPLFLPRAGLLWSVPGLAPLLGAIGLGPGYLGVAGLAPTWPRRAGLGAAGFLWLAAAEVLTGHAFLFGVADGTLPRFSWESSVTNAASDALFPTISSPALAPIVVWAAFAAILPLAVRGRSLMLDVLGGAVWGTALVLAHAALAELVTGSVVLGHARGAVPGAVLAVVVAIAAAALGVGRERPDPAGSSVGWPAEVPPPP